MPGREQIREVILGAAEGATGTIEALAAAGLAAVVEDFDVEVGLAGEGSPGLTAVVRFAIVVGDAAVVPAARSVA